MDPAKMYSISEHQLDVAEEVKRRKGKHILKQPHGAAAARTRQCRSIPCDKRLGKRGPQTDRLYIWKVSRMGCLQHGATSRRREGLAAPCLQLVVLLREAKHQGQMWG